VERESEKTSNAGAAFPSVAELTDWLPQFEFEQQISSGLHSAVYFARQPALERRVMIRIMPEPAPEMAPLLMDRLRTRARLVHPKIVSVFDFGRTHAGPLYLVTEYVHGVLLHELIREKKVTPKEAYQLAVQLCDTLQVVHDHHVIHGALSTRAVLVTRDWQIKLTGIGMTEMPDGELSWLGDATATFDDDIKSLGVVIHEMFCGTSPGANGALSPALPAAFARVVARCMDAEPSRRFERPQDVRAALADALRAEKEAAGVTAKPHGPRAPAPLPPQMPGQRPAASAPPRVQPGQIPIPDYRPPPRRSLMRRIDDFLWSLLRASLHLAIFGGTILILGAYFLLKDKVIWVDPEAQRDQQVAAGQLPTGAETVVELNSLYERAVSNQLKAAIAQGNGDDVTVLQRELRRLDQRLPLPPQDEQDLPFKLKQAREIYRQERARLMPNP
jgi:hypothetical protein